MSSATEAALLQLPPRQAAAALAAFDVAVFVFDAADASGRSLDKAVASLISVADAARPGAALRAGGCERRRRGGLAQAAVEA